MKTLLLSLVLLVAACGGGAATQTPVPTPIAVQTQPARPSAYDYLSDRSLGFVRIDVAQLRDSPLWAFVPLGFRLILPEVAQASLLEMTEKIDRLTLGFVPEEGGTTEFGVMVLDGSLTLDEVAAAFEQAGQPFERPEMNGMQTVRQGQFVVAAESAERLIVTNGQNEDHLRGELPRSGFENAHAELLARMPAEPTVVFLSTDDPTIEAESVAFGLEVRDGMRARGAWHFSDPARADQQAEEIRAKLASPPPLPPEMAEVLELISRVQVVSEAGHLAVSLDITADEVTRLLPLAQSLAAQNFDAASEPALPPPSPAP